MDKLIQFVSENNIPYGFFGFPCSTHSFIEFYLPYKNDVFNELWRLIECADYNIVSHDIVDEGKNLIIKTDMASYRLIPTALAR